MATCMQQCFDHFPTSPLSAFPPSAHAHLWYISDNLQSRLSLQSMLDARIVYRRDLARLPRDATVQY
jgi:hypothetical protein